MGWIWDGTSACRAIDSPCDPKTESCSGNEDSAFDGDVDIGIGLVFAALQWPEYTDAATNWLLKMECEVNTIYDGKWNYPSKGDTLGQELPKLSKSTLLVPGGPGRSGGSSSDHPPGYFRVFGDFLAAYLDPSVYSNSDRQGHHDFWYKTASTVYEMFERCYDQSGVNPGLCPNVWNVLGSVQHPSQQLRLAAIAVAYGRRRSLVSATTSACPRIRPIRRVTTLRRRRCRPRSTTFRTITIPST